MTAAYYLSLMGHQVTVYEQRPKLGGMLRYGIPDYRLPQEILDRDIDHILSAGVRVHTGVSIGRDLTMEDITMLKSAVTCLRTEMSKLEKQEQTEKTEE